MKKNSSAQSAFFNLRVLIALVVVLAGISLALLATANPPRFVGSTSSHPQTAQIPQKHSPLAGRPDISVLPPGFDCSKIHELGIDRMEGLRWGLIMLACGQGKGGTPPLDARFRGFVQKLMPAPLAYGSGDIDLVTGTETFPNTTQSETFITANPDNPLEICAAFNDSRGANSSNFSGISCSTDGGNTFTRVTNASGNSPFANTFGDPVVLYNSPSGTWFTVWLDGNSPCTLGGYKSTNPSDPNSWTHFCVHQNGGDDRESGWADNNPASPHAGNMYVSWNDFGIGNGALVVSRSTDNGNTWSGEITVSNAEFIRDVQITGDSANGDVYIAGMDEGGGGFPHTDFNLIFKSTDGGATWANTYNGSGASFPGPGVVACSTNPYFSCMFTDNGGYFRHEGWGQPAALNGIVHYVYAQHGTGSDPGDVYYIRSTDGGFTFSSPFKLNTDGGTRPQWQPNLSVSPAGTLLATWYDARDSATCTEGNPAVPCYRMYSRKSNDGGVTWLPDDTLSDVVTPLAAEQDPNIFSNYAGDYDYSSAILTKHMTTWMDGRNVINGQSQQDAFTDQELVGFAVTTTNPACGSVVTSQPTDFIINLSDAVNEGTVDPTDFTVNGIAADSDSFSNGDLTITFHFNTTPVTNQGQQSMHIPAGAFTRQSDNQGVFEFQCTFNYDQTLLAVTDTVPPDGGSFQPPGPASYTYDMNFNEPFDEGSVQTSDLQLSGLPGASVTAVTFLNGDTTAEFTININSIFSGTLTITLPAGAITDQFGNGNQAFTGNYQYVGNAPPGCGLLVGSGMTTGFLPNGWEPTLASNTVQYTFAVGQPAANDFALFETHDPWGFTVIKDAITSNGHTYTEFTPNDLATVNFSDYRVIILNWDDTTAPEFITPYTAAIPELEAYMGAGGVVWVTAAIQSCDSIPMPFGGQGTGCDFSDSDPVADPASPMMANMPNPIPGTSASHLSFTGLPAPAHVVVTASTTGNPTLYDIQFGGTCGGTPTPTPTPGTPTPTPTPGTPTPTPTPGTPTPTPTPGTPTPTPTPTPGTPTPTPTVTVTPTATPRATPRPRPTPFPRPTPP